MSKKGIKNYHYFTKTEKKYFDLPIKLSADFSLYFSGKDFPEELKKNTRHSVFDQNKFDSIEELDRKVGEIIEEFEAQFLDDLKEKVILYAISKGSYRCPSIGLTYTVCIKITTHKAKAKKYRSEGHSSGENIHYYHERQSDPEPGVPRSINYDSVRTSEYFDNEYFDMPWTSEREAFFILITKNIAELSNRLEEGIGTRVETLIKRIETGGLQLLENTKEDIERSKIEERS